MDGPRAAARIYTRSNLFCRITALLRVCVCMRCMGLEVYVLSCAIVREFNLLTEEFRALRFSDGMARRFFGVLR